MASVQKRISNEFIEKNEFIPRMRGAKRVQQEARICAYLLPPSSFVMIPVRATVTAPARAGKNRNAKSESPKNKRLSHKAVMEKGG